MSGRWHPIYQRVVLEPGFAQARAYFFYPMLEVSIAHVLMLVRQQIIDPLQGRRLLRALRQVLARGPDHLEYDPQFEDLFFQLEAELAGLAGDEALGNLHVAMSRNDLDTAMYRMVLREEALASGLALARLREVVLKAAAEHVETVMPAYTHNQQAQPTTLAHYLAAVDAELAKDQSRLADLWPRLNRSPLGAAALATSGYPVDREYVAALLGFDGLVENAYEAVASADFSAEYAAWAHLLLGHLSRFLTDLLFWCTNEVAVVRLPEAFIQVSSIMPQKRNPVALEHLRALTTRAMADAVAVLQQVHNVPYGDINDVNDDLQPVLRRLHQSVVDILGLLAEVVAAMEVDPELLHRRAAGGFATSTEVADVLVRIGGLPFRTAHRIVSRLVDELAAQGRTLAELDLALLDRLAVAEAGRPSGLTPEQLHAAVDPVQFVAVRRVRGGPAPNEMRRSLQAAVQQLDHDRSMVEARRARLEEARRRRLGLVDQFLEGGMPGE